MIKVRNLSKEFDGVKALDNVSFELQKGTITALIGPNGAGKTTAFNIITGFLPADKGEVWIRGKRLKGLSPWNIARLGLARTFQNIRLFPQMSVLENLMLALVQSNNEGLGSALLRRCKLMKKELKNEETAIQYLEQAGLEEKREALAQELSHGQRKLLELARALASEPELLLLDEPTAGVFPNMVVEIKKMLGKLRVGGRTILFIEHDMNVVMDISDRVIVLNFGKLIADGTPEEIQKNEAVIEAYLGRKSSRVA